MTALDGFVYNVELTCSSELSTVRRLRHIDRARTLPPPT